MSLHPPSGGAFEPAAPAASPYRFGKYTLLAKLAQGGMGEVFAALLTGEAGFEKVVVIKRILPHLAEDPRFVSMFLTEARVTASLSHPNICQVLELGQMEGEYYLAMEYLEGVSLARLIRQNIGRGLDIRIAAGIVGQTLEGLQFAHCFRQPGRGVQGVIHRDMSPSNVFVTSAGLVKVLDFGVAKVTQHPSTTATGLKGKYPYMSPEQIRSQEVDGRADVFSVGVLLYEAVTGRSLFHRSNDFETLFAVVEGRRPSASETRPDVPLGVEEVIDRSLRVSREERFSSAREMSEALNRAVAPLGGPATIGQLADLVRRDCADDLEDERERIHNATAYLKSLGERGQEPPSFMNRRARAISQPERGSGPAAPDNRATQMRSPVRFVESTRTSTPAGISDASLLRSASRSRRNLVAVLVVGATLSAGAAGWWLRGSPETRPARPTPPIMAEGAVVPDEPRRQPAEPVVLRPAPSRPDPARPERVAVPAEPVLSDQAVSKALARDADKRSRPRSGRKSSSAEPAYLSLDAFPYAHIYIDGELAGITPLVRIQLKPGRHSVRAVAANGAEKRLTLNLRPGQVEFKRLQLELIEP